MGFVTSQWQLICGSIASHTGNYVKNYMELNQWGNQVRLEWFQPGFVKLAIIPIVMLLRISCVPGILMFPSIETGFSVARNVVSCTRLHASQWIVSFFLHNLEQKNNTESVLFFLFKKKDVNISLQSAILQDCMLCYHFFPHLESL